MKIAMTLLCRDEIDIIRTQIRYHRPKVDFMIVTDNGSIDGTREALLSMQAPDLIVLEEKKHNHDQYVFVHNMITVARELGADWVVNSDADEFFFGDIRATIEDMASRGANCFDVPWHNFYPTWRDDPNERVVPRRILWRKGGWEKDSKAVHSIEGYQSVSEGNHVVHMDYKKLGGRAERLRVFHFSNRGWFNWRNKTIRAGQAYECNTTLEELFGSHVRKAYRAFKEGGDEALYQIWEEGYASSDEDIQDRGLVFDPRLAREFGLRLSEVLPMGDENG